MSSLQPNSRGIGRLGSILASMSLGTGLGLGSFLGGSCPTPFSGTIGGTSQQQDPQSQFVALMQKNGRGPESRITPR
ncbi:hypothetical protein BS17DRAFT_779255, partial [Gyrodon lividus]